MKTSRSRYAAKIQRVIDHIHGHSAERIDSAAVAEIAQLSPYHWHRIYRAVTGESAVATLRRVKLERSAAALLRDNRSVAEVAADCGFDNLQAFTRLFRSRYGVPPGQFRTRSTKSPDSAAADNGVNVAERNHGHRSDNDAGTHAADSPPAPVDIVERSALSLAGLWHQGDYMDIGRAFEKVMAVAEIESWPRAEPFTVGVYFDDPDVVSLENCRAFAGIPVPREFAPPAGFDVHDIAGGTYATCLHVGPYARLSESYRGLFRGWLQESERDTRDEPCHEIYLNSPFNTPPTELETMICLPLA